MIFLSIKLAIRNLLAHKKQSFLTMLGVIIGVMSVISIMSIGEGAQSLILNQIKKMGTNLVGVVAGKSEEENSPPAIARGIIITSLKTKDAEMIRSIPHVQYVTPIVFGTANTVSQSHEDSVSFNGVGHEMAITQDFDIKKGRFISLKDEKSNAKVVVLGQQIVKKFFPHVNPLGQQIKIKHEHFRVIGIFKEKGATLFLDNDNIIYMPVTTAQKLLLGIDYLHVIRLKVDETKNIAAVTNNIEKIVRRSHNIQDPKKDDFSVRTLASALDILESVTDALKLFLSAIAGISLIVGGIGIMNMMLITVTQRTREIGLRKAVGAKPKAIIIQFLIESSTITLLGGICGIIIGISFSTFIALLIQALGYDWTLIITPLSISVSLSISLIIGIVFGLYPAIKASRLHPIEALRYQ